MSNTISDHILSLDGNILAARVFTKDFRVIASSTSPNFDTHFQLGPAIENAIPAYAASVYGTTRLLEMTFGDVQAITANYKEAKIMLLKLRDEKGIIQLILKKSAKSEYLAVMISKALEEDHENLGVVA